MKPVISTRRPLSYSRRSRTISVQSLLDETDGSLGGSTIPTTNTTGNTGTTKHYKTIPVTAIPIGGPVVTARKLYRRFNSGGPFRFVATIGDNTDRRRIATRSRIAPWARRRQQRIRRISPSAGDGVPIGGAVAVTAARIYRTAAGGAALQLLTTIPNNTDDGIPRRDRG